MGAHHGPLSADFDTISGPRGKRVLLPLPGRIPKASSATLRATAVASPGVFPGSNQGSCALRNAAAWMRLTNVAAFSSCTDCFVEIEPGVVDYVDSEFVLPRAKASSNIKDTPVDSPLTRCLDNYRHRLGGMT